MQALIKAAVNSALQFADKNGMRSPDHTLGSSLGQTAAVEQAIAPTSTSQALHELLSSRLSIMEDRIEGVEVLQLSQMNDTVPMEKFLAVQSMAAKLDGRLKVSSHTFLNERQYS